MSPSLWMCVPHIVTSDSSETFEFEVVIIIKHEKFIKTKMKTFLFSQYFDSN